MQILGVMVRTNNSTFTKATYQAAEKVLVRAKKKGHIVIDLTDEMAQSQNLLRVLNSIGSPKGNFLKVVLFYCEVQRDSPVDHKGKPFITTKTIDAFKGWGVYCVGCYVGSRLASKLVKAGSTFVIAFASEVSFVSGHEKEVMQGLNAGALRMIDKGVSPIAAADYMRFYFLHEARRILQSRDVNMWLRLLCLHRLAETVRYCGSNLGEQLHSIEQGRKQAYKYQSLVADILSHLFSKDLGIPQMEVETRSGTSRYDIVFFNKAREGLWQDLKIAHGNSLVIFDTKNKMCLSPSDADQMLRYSSDWRGKVLFIVTRKKPSSNFETRVNEMLKEKNVCLLILTDSDLEDMLILKDQGNNPMNVIEDKLMSRLQSA